MLDFFDPDPTKRIYCQNEIYAKIRADLIRKYGEGNLPTDPNKLYDLESDTSGSDSSSDEGLPAHIEHIQQSQVLYGHFDYRWPLKYNFRRRKLNARLVKNVNVYMKIVFLLKIQNHVQNLRNR